MVIEFASGGRMSEECADQECDEGRVCFFAECCCDCHEHEQWSPSYGWVDNDWWTE
jgi:hypothetical protein